MVLSDEGDVIGRDQVGEIMYTDWLRASSESISHQKILITDLTAQNIKLWCLIAQKLSEMTQRRTISADITSCLCLKPVFLPSYSCFHSDFNAAAQHNVINKADMFPAKSRVHTFEAERLQSVPLRALSLNQLKQLSCLCSDQLWGYFQSSPPVSSPPRSPSISTIF